MFVSVDVNVIVSPLLVVVIDTLLPAANVTVSVLALATKLSCPEIDIVFNAFWLTSAPLAGSVVNTLPEPTRLPEVILSNTSVTSTLLKTLALLS